VAPRRKSHPPQQETESVVPLRSGDNEMRSRLMLFLVIAALVVLFVLLAGGPTAGECTTTPRDSPTSERIGRSSQDSRKGCRAFSAAMAIIKYSDERRQIPNFGSEQIAVAK